MRAWEVPDNISLKEPVCVKRFLARLSCSTRNGTFAKRSTSVAWMDEIIAVDSDSADKTVEICREFTPHVFQRKWHGFGEQKNSAIDRATSDWVFILDADERVSDDLRVEIQRVLETSPRQGRWPIASKEELLLWEVDPMGRGVSGLSTEIVSSWRRPVRR